MTELSPTLQIGKTNCLSISRKVDFGAYLQSGDQSEVLLPRRFVPAQCQVGDQLEVFVAYDSEDRLVATTETPLGKVGDFALLKVISTTAVGAFLNWGLGKDLLLPFSEQSRELAPGQDVVVFISLDKSQRIVASMRIEKHLQKTAGSLKEEQEVALLIFGRTELGYKAIINNEHLGVIYENEVFQKLNYGQRCQGYIHKIRTDGKVDLRLQKTGYKAVKTDVAPKILQMLEERGGFLAINDKTPAETIYELFGVSKKKYKMALGGLYKRRQIRISDEGLHLATGH